MGMVHFEPRVRQPYGFQVELYSGGKIVWSKDIEHGFCNFQDGHWVLEVVEGEETIECSRLTGNVVVERIN